MLPRWSIRSGIRNFASIFKPAWYDATKSEQTLKKFIVDKIKVSGPITVAEYMKMAVNAPTVGYYGGFSQKRQVFGSEGDFITSPELTQLFGEMIGVWIYYELANTGYNGDWHLIENGPGTGSLMVDVLNSLEKFKEKNLRIHLVETSNTLIDRQEQLLCKNPSGFYDDKNEEGYIKRNITRQGFPIYWYRNVDDIPDGFSVFIANEFLDALPIHQFSRGKDGVWHEVYVNINRDEELCFMNSKGENLHTKGLLPKEIREASSPNFYEISPDSGTYVNQVAERIIQHGGFSLIIDYGHSGEREDLSLRAYKKHKQVDPLSNPGNVDITADVNFKYLKNLVEDRTLVYGPVTQREFLAQLGIEVRLRRLLPLCKDRTEQENLIKSYNYLMGEMGTRFQGISLFPKTLSSILEQRGGPAGFSTGNKQTSK